MSLVVPLQPGNAMRETHTAPTHNGDGATGSHHGDCQPDHTTAEDVAKLQSQFSPSYKSSTTRRKPLLLLALPQELQDIIFDFAYPQMSADYIHVPDWKSREARRWREARRDYTKKPFPGPFVDDFLISKAFFVAAAKAWAGNQNFDMRMSFCQGSDRRMQGIVPAFARTVEIDRYDFYLVTSECISLRSLTIAADERMFWCLEDEVLVWEDELSEEHFEQVVEANFYKPDRLSENLTMRVTVGCLKSIKVETNPVWERNVAKLEAYLRKRQTSGKAKPATLGWEDDSTSRPSTLDRKSSDISENEKSHNDEVPRELFEALLAIVAIRRRKRTWSDRKSARSHHLQCLSIQPEDSTVVQRLEQSDGKQRLIKAVGTLGRRHKQTIAVPVLLIVEPTSVVPAKQSDDQPSGNALPLSHSPTISDNPRSESGRGKDKCGQNSDTGSVGNISFVERVVAVSPVQLDDNSESSSPPSSPIPTVEVAPKAEGTTPHGTSLEVGTLSIRGVNRTLALVGTPESNSGSNKAVQNDETGSIEHDSKGGLANPTPQHTRVLDDGEVPETVDCLSAIFRSQGQDSLASVRDTKLRSTSPRSHAKSLAGQASHCKIGWKSLLLGVLDAILYAGLAVSAMLVVLVVSATTLPALRCWATLLSEFTGWDVYKMMGEDLDGVWATACYA
ncbi:hypothetical protein LTR01_001092 [Friedmanniomyces endolithicus]|nr:hypothetical protein LTR01_001092 [Friedmanniomyces endolithicus]KAK0833758.1 hypothetical protein LTR73_001521 [Friedmanniomyces endolithicus]